MPGPLIGARNAKMYSKSPISRSLLTRRQSTIKTLRCQRCPDGGGESDRPCGQGQEGSSGLYGAGEKKGAEDVATELFLMNESVLRVGRWWKKIRPHCRQLKELEHV